MWRNSGGHKKAYQDLETWSEGVVEHQQREERGRVTSE